MKEENDAQLIDDILSGDDAAFNTLVHKYQKGVHALAWRKIGDFHYAEEIAQDTFLKAYKNLPTLKDPNQFAGWLYVIANRLCINWIQRNKSAMQSLEDTPVREIEQSSYTHYVSQQREARATEDRYDLAKKILEKLPESERTVMTLYYLGEMTTKEIGRFLGVSVNTITSRLQRARRRLQEDQELLIQEVLGGVPIPTSLAQNIMKQVTHIKPTPSSAGKPFLPWVAFGTAVIVALIMMLGASNQYLRHFQKPYSFEARSEPTIEIIDAPITLTIDTKPAVRNQTGSVATPSENSSIGLQTSESVLTPNTQTNPFRPSISQWTQSGGPQGSPVFDLFATSGGTVYAATPASVYKLTPEAAVWTPINVDPPVKQDGMSMTEHRGVLYIVYPDQVLTSVDNGEMWNVFSSRPTGYAVGLVITDKAQLNGSHGLVSMYLALQDKGIFHATNVGKQWIHLHNGLTGKRIYAIDAVENTVFAGTNHGLYRLNSDVWEKLPVGGSNAVHSLAVRDNNLYVGMGSDPFVLRQPNDDGEYGVRIVTKNSENSWKIYLSIDLGESWTEITPSYTYSAMRVSRSVKILVEGKTLLAIDGVLSFRSNDAGQTWTDLGSDRNSVIQNIFPAVALDDNTFYRAGEFGIHRTTDAGESWHPFMTGMVGTTIQNLAAFNNRLYIHTGTDIVQSTDSGNSWKDVRVTSGKDTSESIEQKHLPVSFFYDSKLTVAAGTLYGIAPEKYNLRIFQLSTNTDMLIPVQGIPAFDEETTSIELQTAIMEAEQIYIPDKMKKDPKLTKFAVSTRASGFTVSGDETFYVEHQRRLFKWKPGDPQWTNTGLIDLGKQPDEDLRKEFRLAVSGETVYVGKRTGQLFQSLDSADTWKDITPILPLHFTRFNEIIFAGSTVYVATDKGVISSQNGESWRNLTDEKGTPIIIDRFTIDHATIYGVGDTGLYRLDTRRKWQRILPSVPDKVISLVINNDKLYIATQHRGMFHISLEKEAISQIELTTDSHVAY